MQQSAAASAHMAKEGLTVDEAPVSKGLVDDVDELCGWLQREARICDKIIDSTLQKLEHEDVFTVRDLGNLRDAGGLEDVFTRVTAAKITAALAQLGLHDGAPAAVDQVQAKLVQPPQPPQSPQPQSEQPVAQTPEKPNQASQAPPGETSIAAPTSTDAPEGAIAGTSEAMSDEGSHGGKRRRKRGPRKGKGKGKDVQQADGQDQGFGPNDLISPAADSVKTNGTSSSEPSVRLDGAAHGCRGSGSHCNSAGPAQSGASRTPLAASAPRGAPDSAAARQRLYTVATRSPWPPDRHIPNADRRGCEVWCAIELYDKWLHGAQLRRHDYWFEAEGGVPYPGGDSYPPSSHEEAPLVTWLLARFNPADRSRFSSADRRLERCVDARLPTAEQLAQFRDLGWPDGPPTALELEKLMVEYSEEQDALTRRTEGRFERQWHAKHGRGKTAVQDYHLMKAMDGCHPEPSAGRSGLDDDVPSDDSEDVDGAAHTDSDEDAGMETD
mgnify:CR=1 FL=1|jgi:hypothetical protein